MLSRVVIDTSAYIDRFAAGRHLDVVAGWRLGVPTLSVVVAMELLRGEPALKTWVNKFIANGRLLGTSPAVWTRATRVMRKLDEAGVGGDGLLADVLIAMSAREEGMKVFTTNGRHFERIAAVESFRLEVAEGRARGRS